jgi:3-oxoacyl-[acyl-carrier protein] reductase
MLGLDGKRILVTGGSRGIGRAITMALAGAGAYVATCYRADEQAARTLSDALGETGGRHRVTRADVTDEADVDRLIEDCRAQFGGLDVIVNNAGIDAEEPFADIDQAEWERVLDTNLTSLFRVTHTALPLLSETSCVINVGASVANRGRPGRTHYTAAKAGIAGLTRSLCKELGPRGVRVNTVAPGIVANEAGADFPPAVLARFAAMIPMGRLAAPADVANAVLFLASPLAAYVSGITLNVDGGL